MSFFSSLRSVVSTLFHRSRMEKEVEDELRAHIQDRAKDLERSGVRTRRRSDVRGSSSADARNTRKKSAKRGARISSRP
jgi:hypothetical protein